MKTTPTAPNSKGFRFPSEMIRHTVWWSVRFSLSDRDGEDLLAQRGMVVTSEPVRQWSLKCGQTSAKEWRRRRPRCGDTGHLDEVVLTLRGQKHALWRAGDPDGQVLDLLIQSRRQKHAAKRFFRKLRVWAARRAARDHARQTQELWCRHTRQVARWRPSAAQRLQPASGKLPSTHTGA